MKKPLDDEAFKREYGILCRRLYPDPEKPTPFGSTWCVIEPGGATLPHDHHEGETFFVLSGNGVMEIESETTDVGPGDVVYMAPFSSHVLKNASSTESLTFLSVWWEPRESTPGKLPERSFITVAPPTPNGGLHLGHLSGPYLASDIYRRYLAMRGVRTHFASGTDDNQSYVPTKGMKLGLSPEAVAEKYGASIESTFAKAGIGVDYLLRPLKNPEYVAFVQDFFTKLTNAGKIAKREAPTLFCAVCDRYLVEAHVRGGCPHCATITNGHGCERCGITNDAVDLGDPRCNHCDRAPEVRRTERYFFPLSAYTARLAAYHGTVALSPRLRAFTRGLIDRGLFDIPASFPAGWGIPVPGEPGQVIYEWVEMAAGYLYMAERLEKKEDWNPFKAAGNGTEMVQCFGFDNSFFYTTLIPALFLAVDEGTRLPRAFLTNELYQLEGKKFSTSRSHAVWAEDMLAKVPADVVRLYLAATRPESTETDFRLAEMRDFVAGELVGQWESLRISLDVRLKEHFGGRAPKADLSLPDVQRFHAELRSLVRRAATHYQVERFSTVEVVRSLTEIVRLARRFSSRHGWEKDVPSLQESWASTVGMELAALKALAMVAAPVMPDFSNHTLKALGEASATWDESVTPVKPGTPVATLHDGAFTHALSALDAFAKELS